jgi:hypothetical protein
MALIIRDTDIEKENKIHEEVNYGQGSVRGAKGKSIDQWSNVIQVLQKNTSMWTLRLLRIGHTRFYMDFFTCIVVIHQSYTIILNVTKFL